MNEFDKDWKLKLRYGKLSTPYKHYTLIAPVVIPQYIEDFDAKPGKAYIGVKVWSRNHDHAFEMLQDIGEQIGYTLTGKIELYDTDPKQAPDEEPYAYDINFNYFE